MIANQPAGPAAGRPRRPVPPAGALVTGLGVSLVLALTGCGGGEPAGAAAPAVAGSAPAASITGQPAGTPSTTPGAGTTVGSSTTAGAGAVAGASDSPGAAAGVVTAYFTEIDAASRAGRVADVAALALPGCQACALDVGVTRDLAQRGLRTDADPYAVTAVDARPRAGLACAVTFLATTSSVGLVDPAGRRVDEAPGVPVRSGTAELALTGAGWRIQTIRYTRRQP
ncbi:hypothetical protein I6A60_34525 [Frankia sp. AgB1.9]|uniref:hypothetical protein n=1 Tax=unclassified Frankia TaxID=2632575 RepID=UPI001933767B|nr:MULTISPECIES: hypothetical protein [unclassified Frankia]MBL7494553.1 hypothetical protein [Frankia sp. AgW1.1]MBL7552931.1 hypothetical protein [Frankia sp. AgB1.9]MBL7622220.1 hypothetical protein [Frankia sp. AgB1.8]